MRSLVGAGVRAGGGGHVTGSADSACQVVGPRQPPIA